MSTAEQGKQNAPEQNNEQKTSQQQNNEKQEATAEQGNQQQNKMPSRPKMPSMQEMLQHKQKMMPLVRFLKKHGLKFKHANCMNVRVEYFRMDMFNNLIEEKKNLVQQQGLSGLVDKIKEDLVFFKRQENSEKLKYPQMLLPIKKGSQQGKFAAFKFDTTESKKIYVFLVVFLILAAVLFPLWPYQLKYGVWIVCLYFMILIVAIVIIRLILYVFAASFGVSFWLLPNLFGDYGIMDSLKPFYSVEKWENDVLTIILRVLAFGIFLYYCNSIYQEPEFYLENFQATKVVIDDVHDWGVSKIKGEAGNFSQRAITMENILNQTQDAFDQPKEDYTTSFEQPPVQPEQSVGQTQQPVASPQQPQHNNRQQTVKTESAPQM